MIVAIIAFWVAFNAYVYYLLFLRGVNNGRAC